MQEASTLSCKKGEIPKKDFTFPLYQAKTSRGLHPWRFAPVAARSARAHQETSARARRGLLKKPSPPPAGAPPPKGEARLGSPFGGAGTAAAVTERAATNSQPSPGEAAFSLPHRPGKALRCFPSFFSCAARPVRARSWGAAPHPAAFEKAGKTFTLASLGPRRARALPFRTGAAFSRRPLARIDSGGTPHFLILLPSTCESPPKTPGHTFAAWPGPRRARPAAPPASGAGRLPWPPRWRWRR